MEALSPGKQHTGSAGIAPRHCAVLPALRHQNAGKDAGAPSNVYFLLRRSHSVQLTETLDNEKALRLR